MKVPQQLRKILLPRVKIKVATDVTVSLSDKDDPVPQAAQSHLSGSPDVPALDSEGLACRENRMQNPNCETISFKTERDE